MITIRELKPQYEFGNPEKDVLLVKDELLKIICGADVFEGCGEAVLHVGRKPRIKFNLALENTPELLGKIFEPTSLLGPALLELINRNILLENGHICNFGGGVWSVESGKSKPSLVSWESLREPYIVEGDESTEIDHFVFHLLNCPNLSKYNFPIKTIGGGGYTVCKITLVWKDWIIEFRTLKDTDKKINFIKRSGGFGLTHIGIIRKKDSSSFSIKEVGLLRIGFSQFMNFAVGRTCQPALCVGHKENKKVYEDFATPFSDWYSPMTWASGYEKNSDPTETLEALFPLFMDAFTDEKEKAALSESISWYLSATEPGRPQIDQLLILLQAGIERLAYEYTVNRKRLIHKTGFKDLRASDRFRLLFSSLGLPLDIPANLLELTKSAKALQWEDIPHCLTEIRNSIVHPEHKRKGKFGEVYFEAWQLAIEYMELSILGFCGFKGKYYSRIENKIKNVPWV